MSTKAQREKLWPKLRFQRLGRLDWAVIEYVPAPLAALGKELQASPQRPVDWAIGQLLKDLSGSPTALKALNRLPRRAPPETRALNVAVHYLAWQRMKDKTAAAQWDVAKTWGMRPSAVKAGYRQMSDKAAIELDAIIEMCLSRKRHHTTIADVLRDVDLDMRARAKLRGFHVKASTQRY